MHAVPATDDDAINEFRRARDACERSLVELSHYRRKVRPWLEELAAEAGPDETVDMYGERAIVADFEHEIATLLGKEAAVLMPSGTMAQQVALRIWAEGQGSRRVAFHPLCHLEIHEAKAYQALHQLEGVLVGEATELIALEALKAIQGRLAALLLELPQREIGGQLPTWEELTAQISWARERRVRLHLDGARLLEAAPAMGHSLPEISGLFDSVYISLYKGLGGLAGALLCGPEGFIAEARIWRQRHGGNMFRMFPMAVSGRSALHRKLGRFPLYRQRALRLAEALKKVPGVRLVPDPPQSHMMHAYLPGRKDELLRRATAIAKRDKVALFRYLDLTELPDYCKAELEMGEDALEVTDAEVTTLYRRLLQISDS
ncbi:MAG: aminotransferase class I/II-fold pyridoxal phosphate-dependent enzyme [Candidatus Dormibacteria bacterium]